MNRFLAELPFSRKNVLKNTLLNRNRRVLNFSGDVRSLARCLHKCFRAHTRKSLQLRCKLNYCLNSGFVYAARSINIGAKCSQWYVCCCVCRVL